MVIVFDTETTGKIIDYKVAPDGSDNFPNIVQLGWAVYTDDGKVIAKTSNIIKPKGWTIEEEAEEVHGISLKQCEEEGIDIMEALLPFVAMYRWSNYVIAHNIDFDSKVFISELIRNGATKEVELYKSKKKICTMSKTTDYCKLPNPNTRYNTYKWPKLEELYRKLFDEEI